MYQQSCCSDDSKELRHLSIFAKINGEQVWKLVENYLDHTEDEFSITNKYELPILSGMKITVQKEENGFLLKDIAVDQEK